MPQLNCNLQLQYLECFVYLYMAIMVVGWEGRRGGGVMSIMYCNLYEITLRRKTRDKKVKEHEDKLWLQAARNVFVYH